MFPPPSTSLPKVRKNLQDAMLQQITKKNQQDLTEAVHKSVEASTYGGFSHKDAISWPKSSPCPYTHVSYPFPSPASV